MNFREYIKEKYKGEEILEFGPLTRPLYTKEENKNISFVDIRSTEEIKKLYGGNDYLKKTGITVNVNDIVDVDYKIDGSYANTFKNKKFKNAYLSHVIEHMPDILGFFLDISKILKKDGELIIIYPDKRYCFDHYRNSVSFRDAYATYKYGKAENARMAFDFGYNVVHENDACFFWNGEDLTKVISNNNLSNAEEYYDEILKGNQIDDVHYWPFSDVAFLRFIYEAQRANLFPFEISEFYPTQENTQEFMIILKRSSNVKENTQKTISLISKYDETNVNLENRKELEKLRKELDIKEEAIVAKENELKGLKEKIKKSNDEILKLKEELDKVYNSKSMRITKPLRVISSKIWK